MTNSLYIPGLFIRLAEMIAFTVFFGTIGRLFLFLFVDRRTTATSRPSENIGTAISAGLILVICLIIGLSFANIPITKTNLLLAFAGFYAFSASYLYKKDPDLRTFFTTLTQEKILENLLPFTIFLIVLTVRAVEIKGVIVPNWHDGLFHVSLLSKFLTNAKIPLDNVYHIGFHIIALTVYYFSGASLSETVLVTGQWLCAIGGLTFYYFSLQYTRNIYISGAIYGIYSFFLIFPSYLTSLSRYPFLFGLALLPFTISTSLNWITKQRPNYLVAIISVIALGLTHYGALLIWFAFIFAYIIDNLVSKTKKCFNLLHHGREDILRLTLLILPLLLIILPKAIKLITHPAILANMIANAQGSDFSLDLYTLSDKLYAEHYFFYFIWILWLLWSFTQRKELLFVTWLWPFMVWFFTWAQYQIIGISISTYVNLLIFLSMPLAIAIGLMLKELLLLIYTRSSRLLCFSKKSLNSFLATLLIIEILFGIHITPRSIDQEKALFTNDDLLAMEWIENNTPVNSVFMIRTIIWDNKTLVPSDGGGWINFTTGRRIIIPQLGELYDLCKFSKTNGVGYLYFGNETPDETFDLRLDNFSKGSYSIAYQNKSVKILSLSCP